MNKTELVKAVSEKADITLKQAVTVVDAVLDSIKEALQKGEEVRLIGFGTFKIVTRKERQGVNPKTGEKITIPSKKIVKFSPGKDLKAL